MTTKNEPRLEAFAVRRSVGDHRGGGGRGGGSSLVALLSNYGKAACCCCFDVNKAPPEPRGIMGSGSVPVALA